MNPDTTNEDLLKLRSLLTDRSSFVPHCDLDQGFLDDLHMRIRSEELRTTPFQDLLNKIKYYFDFEIRNNTSLAGAAVAALVIIAYISGVALKDNKETEVSKIAPTTEKRNVLIKSDDVKHFKGTIPVFTEESSEF